MNVPSDKIPARDLQPFDNAEAAVERLKALYDSATNTITTRFIEYSRNEDFRSEVRECYPYVLKRVDREAAQLDSRVSFGFCHEVGVFGTTISRPDLFQDYLTRQLRHLLKNHGGVIEVGVSEVGIPAHFAFRGDIAEYSRTMSPDRVYGIRHYFDVPDLAYIDDHIVNGTHHYNDSAVQPLSLFTGQRIDYSLHRLKHYTGTEPEHFQQFVLFTNYGFYVDEFIRLGHDLMAKGEQGEKSPYIAFVEPGNRITHNANYSDEPATGLSPARMPQMPAYHLKTADGQGITLVNIGVGPSNAKTITDHIAVLRPHCWLMVGHCAGLRSTQRLGDYVLAHAYLREDHVLDDDLPPSAPVPAIAEVQTALQEAADEITGLSNYETKRLLRTGTVATVDDRNWELRDFRHLQERFSQSRAIALDMESATIAANGFRFRVPYGTLLCVSDKPLHGEIKLPGMADHFYRERVNQHLKISIRAMELLRERGPGSLHSRKLRTFTEPAFR
jgi:AMP nucleosidase